MKVELVYFRSDEEMYQVKDYRVVIRKPGLNGCTCMHGTIKLNKPSSRCKHIKQVQKYRAKKQLV